MRTLTAAHSVILSFRSVVTGPAAAQCGLIRAQTAVVTVRIRTVSPYQPLPVIVRMMTACCTVRILPHLKSFDGAVDGSIIIT